MIRMLVKNLMICFLICLSLYGCQPERPHSPTLFVQNRMTIDYRILIGDIVKPEQRKEIQSIIDSTFYEIDTIYNKWNPSSELSQLNAMKGGEVKVLSPQLYSFLERVGKLVQISGGLFDPTVEPLELLWISKLTANQEPTAAEIEDLASCIGWDKIHLINRKFYKDDSRTQIDLGGVAKGYCVDLLIERLTKARFANLYVEWGGEIRTTGTHPAKRPWNIYISRLHDTDPQHALAWLSLYNQAIATSGDYHQTWTIQTTNGKKTYTHIFNPKTMAPVIVQPGSVASATLVAEDCVTADALAKVLMLFNSAEEAEQWVKSLPYLNVSYWIATRKG